MEHSKQLAEVRAAIVKAVPEIDQGWSLCPYCEGNGAKDPENYDEGCHCPGSVGRIPGHPIRLSDVLRAVANDAQTRRAEKTADGIKWPSIHKEVQATTIAWDWSQDSLDDQSEETIAFLWSILCV